MNFFFNSDIANLLLKANGRRDRRHNFLIFIVRSTLIVGAWLVVE